MNYKKTAMKPIMKTAMKTTMNTTMKTTMETVMKDLNLTRPSLWYINFDSLTGQRC